jgi:CBS domain containing-hemolysin-like protein
VAGLSSPWLVGLGMVVLGVHLVSVALRKALRSYSRSRLEELCLARGHARRADDVAHHGEATEAAAEALAVVTGLGLAAGLAVAMRASSAGWPRGAVPAIVVAVLAAVALDYLAGAVGQVHAEGVIVRLWPLAGSLRAVTRPLDLARQLSEAGVAHLARQAGDTPRPASVEVELPDDGESPAVVEAELPESVRALIQQAVELTQRSVGELMILRSSVVMLPASVPASTAASTFRETGLSRIPLFGENRDDIVGILYAKDLFPRMTEHGDDDSEDDNDAVRPRAIVRPAYCVPETKSAYDLLDELRSRRTQIAIVLDEYGSVAGLITFEDLLEALVGAIDDEHDVPAPADPLVSLDGSRFEVDATLELEQLNERLALRLPTGGDFLTVGGLAFHALGRVPEPGATFRFSEVEFTVLEVVDHAIRRVRLELQPRAAVSSSP